MSTHQHEAWQIRASTAEPGREYCAACGERLPANPSQNRDHDMSAEQSDTALPDTPVYPDTHRLEIEISGTGMNVSVDYKAVCDAGPGALCRIWCGRPECEEGAVDGHERHTLTDQGECGLVSHLNADPSMIPELYEGKRTAFRPGRITLQPSTDEVTWSYAGPAPEPELTAAERSELEAYRRLDLAGYVEYGVDSEDPAAPGLGSSSYSGLAFHSAVTLRDEAAKKGFKARIMQRIHPALQDWTPTVRPACEENCRHQCPNCRMGLVTHLACDPQCGYHLPAADE